MGDKAAMACTVAIEETIDEHYADQATALGDDEAELRGTIEKFRAEEIQHKDEALAAGAQQAPAYEALTAAIKAGSRLAIWFSTRIGLERGPPRPLMNADREVRAPKSDQARCPTSGS